MSTGGRLAPSSFVISPTWTMPGKCFWVTLIGNGSISLAQTGTIPLRTAASGKPPIPSKREPIVSMARPWRVRGTAPHPRTAARRYLLIFAWIVVLLLSYLLTAEAMTLVVFTAIWAVWTAELRLALVEVSSPKAPAIRGTSPAESISPSPSRA